VYVADTWNSRVQAFDGTGRFLRAWYADFFAPRGIAVDSQGKVFVADTGNSRIVRFSAGGDKEVAWGHKGQAPGELYEPVGIAVDAAGLVYVCDNSNGRLQVFTRDGIYLRSFAVPGWRREIYSEPFVAVDPEGKLWVTVPREHEVRQYSGEGKLLKTLAAARGGEESRVPLGIALRLGASEAVVTDLESGRIERFDTGLRPAASATRSSGAAERPTARGNSSGG